MAENATPDNASAPMKARSRAGAAAQTEGKCRRILAIGSSRTLRGLEAAPKRVKSNHGVKRQTEYQTSIVQFARARHGDDVVARIDEVDLARHPFREARQQIDSGPADVFNCDRAPERRMVALKVEHEACVGDPGACQSPDGSGGDRVDANVVGAIVRGQVSHACLERSLS